MKRIEISSRENTPHFIGCWQLDPNPFCVDIIKFFEAQTSRQNPGATMGGENPEIKKSTDIVIDPVDLNTPELECVSAYLDQLFQCHADYIAQWPFLKSFAPRLDLSSFNIQRYLPGEHFQSIHSERSSLSGAHRLFAWMTYLNDVSDGGATTFSHFGLDIQPRAGKTMIWPAEWTHAHAGQVLNAGKKYIITGWMHFPPSNAAK
ncbi:MAG: 2OG-Fe(II) oxygenase [Rhodospirillaceae bacterium]|nr:2OG-Fe(II) oxygenase [Rhodospirillaceae bacterium]|tara:strand:- start:385 stop:999 length:615 start_codon:yes stop_codon:yes gene_type:complete